MVWGHCLPLEQYQTGLAVVTPVDKVISPEKLFLCVERRKLADLTESICQKAIIIAHERLRILFVYPKQVLQAFKAIVLGSNMDDW